MQLGADLEIIHQPVRLRLMGLVFRSRDVSFVSAREILSLTDGNLATHAAKLVEVGYITSRRVLTRSGFEVRFQITDRGAAAFRQYLRELRRFLEGHARD